MGVLQKSAHSRIVRESTRLRKNQMTDWSFSDCRHPVATTTRPASENQIPRLAWKVMVVPPSASPEVTQPLLPSRGANCHPAEFVARFNSRSSPSTEQAFERPERRSDERPALSAEPCAAARDLRQ